MLLMEGSHAAVDMVKYLIIYRVSYMSCGERQISESYKVGPYQL